MNIDLTTLQGWKDLPDGTYDITVGATADGYTRIKESQAVSVTKETIYNITVSVTNGTYQGHSTIRPNATATVTISANSGYILPSSITVTNAQYTYNSTSGIVSLSNPTGNVAINAVCEQEQPTVEPYLTFSSPSAFQIYVADNTKHWDGTLEYSTDKENWNIWDGTIVLNSGSNNELYLRGTSNTYITGEEQVGWQLEGTDISCLGNIETLLDYQTVANGQHPTMANSCYDGMFTYCRNLTTAPELPATTLANYCYQGMFYYCTSLTQVPALPATTLATDCYSYMFSDCASLYVSGTQTPNAQYEWRIPANGVITGTTYSQSGMFGGCQGIRSGDNLAGEVGQQYTYYTQNPLVGSN